MAEIKGNVSGSNSVNLMTRNENIAGEWDTANEVIKVHYRTITYYLDGENEVIVNISSNKSYLADWATWEPTIKPAVEAELVKEVPGA